MRTIFACVVLIDCCFTVCLAEDLPLRLGLPDLQTPASAPAWVLAQGELSPSERFLASMVYDSARGRIVLFGGNQGQFGETWEWDGTSWVDKTLAMGNPTTSWASAMAYDSARGRTVLFGGGDQAQGGKTWEWDGTVWVDKTPATGNPPAREGAAMAYDAVRGRVVLFGGSGQTGELGDTWEWDGTNWVERTPDPSPPRRDFSSMAYDSARGRIVLFGGADDVMLLSDTWEWDGTTWVEVTPTTRPSARIAPAMAYDSTKGRVVLFGGRDEADVHQSDIWEWDGSAWVEVTPANGPSDRLGHAMAYDSARKRVVLFGGADDVRFLSDTWEWDGAAWVEKTPTAASPSARFFHAMAYDSARGRTVLFGGSSSAGLIAETWEWDGATWVDKTPATGSPSDRFGAAMVYDSARGRTVLFGGSFGNDTWEWDGAAWVEKTPATGNPPGRYGHAMAYDSARGRVVLFGGVNNPTGVVADTWEWDGTTWIDKTPTSGSPSVRYGHAMAYDSARGRVVLFGGNYGNETWEWDGATWVDKTPATGNPPGRSYHAMVYDIARGRTVISGGGYLSSVPYISGPLGDTWEWDGTTWTETTPAQGPSARYGHAMAYDIVRHRTVLFGGYDDRGFRGDTWEYSGGVVCDAGPTYVTVRSTQALAGMTVRDGDVLKVDGCGGGISRVAQASVFGGLGVDGLDVRPDGTLLFSVRSSGYIHHAGGYLHAKEGNVYRLDPISGSIQTIIDWRALGIPIQNLDALDELPDGRIALSTETYQSVRQAGRWFTLRPQNAYAFDLTTRTLSLLFDGARLGLHDIDGFDLQPGGVAAFSTKYDSFAQGVHLKQENAYVVSPAGRITLRFNGRKTGLRTLDDFALGGGN